MGKLLPMRSRYSCNSVFTQNNKSKYAFLFITSLLIFSFIISCASKLKKFKENSDCTTTIVGYYHTELIWKGRYPTLLEKINGLTYPVYGKIASMKEAGVIFIPNLINGEPNSERFLYSKDDLLAVIDSSGHVIYGELPSKYLKPKDPLDVRITVHNEEQPKRFKYEFTMKKDQKFEFCIKPGSYTIVGIQFQDGENRVEKGTDFAKMKFKVDPDSRNYIGDIYLNSPDIEGPKIKVPYKDMNPDGMTMAAFFGGLTGAAIYAIDREIAPPVGHHFLTICNNPNEEFSEENCKINVIEIEKERKEKKENKYNIPPQYLKN